MVLNNTNIISRHWNFGHSFCDVSSGTTWTVFLPLLVYQTLVDIAAGDVVIPIKGNIQKPIVVSKIKINLDSRMNAWVLKCFIITHLANIRNINLSTLIMGVCSNIYY